MVRDAAVYSSDYFTRCLWEGYIISYKFMSTLDYVS